MSSLVCDQKRLRVSLTTWKEKGIVHGFSTRRVPITTHDFYQKKQFDAAKEFCNTLGISIGNLILPKQVHSSHVAFVSRKVLGRLSLFPDCDGLMTRSKEVVLGVLSADCIPVLFYVPSSQTIAVAHAGWKGLQKELPRKMVEQLIRFAFANPTEILVAIGPAIRKCCYEVRQDVSSLFSTECTAIRNGKLYLDLVLILQKQLQQSGIQLDQITDSEICTSCRNEEFFSYRQEGEKSGRILTVIQIGDRIGAEA